MGRLGWATDGDSSARQGGRCGLGERRQRRGRRRRRRQLGRAHRALANQCRHEARRLACRVTHANRLARSARQPIALRLSAARHGGRDVHQTNGQAAASSNGASCLHAAAPAGAAPPPFLPALLSPYRVTATEQELHGASTGVAELQQGAQKGASSSSPAAPAASSSSCGKTTTCSTACRCTPPCSAAAATRTRGDG